MDEVKFFAGLTSITLVVIGLLIFFGLKLNKAVGRHAAEINFPLKITWSGTVLFACVVAFWISCVAIRALRPESAFGVFLNSADGLIAAFAGSIVVAGAAGAVLEKAGFPIAEKCDRS
jgi:hypothetical protein